MRTNRIDWMLVGLLVFFVLIRIPGFWQVLAEDGHVWVNAALAPTLTEKFTLIPHPPFAMLPFIAAGLFGERWILHAVPLLFQTLGVPFTYMIARKLFGIMPARYAVALMAVSVWLITPGTQLDTDGSTLLFFITAALYAYLRMTEWESGISMRRLTWNRLASRGTLIRGAFLGILLCGMMLTKFTSFLVPITLLFGDYLLRGRYDWQTYIRSRAVPYVGGAILFISIIAAVLIFFPQLGTVFSTQGNTFFGNPLEQNFVNVLSIFAQAVILISPLLFALLFFAMADRKLRENKSVLLLFFFIFIYFFFHLFLLTASFRPLERYLLPTSFAFAILGGIVISRIAWTRKSVRLMAGSFVVSLVIFVVQNMQKNTIFPIYPKEEYFTRILSLNWDFLFPFRGSSGPFGFYISFWTIGTAFLFVGVLLLVALQPRFARISLLIILGVGLSYNVIMAEEYLFSGMNPNVNKVGREMIMYAQEHDLPQPLYHWNALGRSSLQDKYTLRWMMYAFKDDPVLIQELKSTNGSILFIDYGKLDENTDLWKVMHECKLEKSFADKGVTLGYVFDCSRRAESSS